MCTTLDIPHDPLHENNDTCEHLSDNPSEVILPIALADAKGKDGRRIKVRILLDSGSTENFIKVGTHDLLDSRKLGNFSLNISTLHGKNESDSDLVRISIFTRDDEEHQIDVYTVKNILKIPRVDINDEDVREKIAKKPLNEAFPRESFSVDILIGIKNFWEFVDGVHERISKEITLLKTKFGPIVCGQLPNKVNVMLTGIERLNKNIEKLFAFEELPGDNSASTLTREEIQAVEQMEEHLRFDPREGRFITKLLWRRKPNLNNNFEGALHRLNGQLRKLRKDPILKQLYKKALDEYLENGILEEIFEPLEKARDFSRKQLFYLPHRDVYDSTRASTKLRIVFDASAKTSSGLSLNDCILAGPPLQQKIASIVLRFRTKKIALIGDCKQMFLQILIEKEDRDFLRVLWKNPDNDDEPIRIFRFTRLIFGATDSPFQAISCLQRLVSRKLKDPDITPLERKCCDIVKKECYVDDITTGASTVQEAKEIYNGLKNLLATGHFPIHKWASNSQEVLKQIPENERAKFDPQSGCSNPTKSLGVKWDPAKDLLLFDDFENLPSSNDDTKRAVASLLASLFDPSGLLGPFILRAREILKSTFVEKMNWTSNLKEPLLSKWHAWVSELLDLKNLSFPRYVRIDHSTQIHVFGDASGTVGYGVAVYARNFDTKLKCFTSDLVLARSRINPKKELKLPRLELTAAVLCVEVAEMIRQELDLKKEQFFCWSDSEITLWWLKKDPAHLIPFVANRVEKIIPHQYCFSYINTKENPADMCSRGCTVKELSGRFWKHGPSFLVKPESDWPKESASFDSIHHLEGVKKQYVYSFSTILQQLNEKVHREALQKIAMKVENLSDHLPLHLVYSSHDKLIRITSVILQITEFWIKRSRFNLSCKEKNEPIPKLNHPVKLIILRNDDTKFAARTFWIRNAQRGAFEKEIKCLIDEDSLPKNSKLRSLNPYLDDNSVLRVGGRLGAAKLPENAKFPIILPKDHGFTRTLMRKVHLQNEHAGTDWCHFHIRQSYWILSSRIALNSIIRSCLSCQKVNAKRGAQQMAPLPRQRVAIDDPFSQVGIDYTGVIKYRKRNKQVADCYLVIFTCLVTRAVHIEVVSTMDAYEFILAFQRMVYQRGNPKNVFTDNALYFKKASKDLGENYARNNKDIQALQDKYKFKWHFTVPYHSSGSGVWERMVRSVKTPLRKVLGNALVTYTELYTIVKQVEAHVNERPLAQMSESSFDCITPSMLVTGRKLRPTVDEFQESGFKQEMDVRERWKHRQTLVRQFFNSWVKNYILSLQQRHKWQDKKPNIRIGDLVLVEKEKLKKHRWPLGLIKDLIIGRDGLIRSVRLTTSEHAEPVTRSIHEIFPLEAASERLTREKQDEEQDVVDNHVQN